MKERINMKIGENDSKKERYASWYKFVRYSNMMSKMHPRRKTTFSEIIESFFICDRTLSRERSSLVFFFFKYIHYRKFQLTWKENETMPYANPTIFITFEVCQLNSTRMNVETKVLYSLSFRLKVKSRQRIRNQNFAFITSSGTLTHVYTFNCLN